MNSNNLTGLHIQNGHYVALEAAPELKGTIVKTHLPLHGDVTYDVQISYKASATWENPEVMRLRDIPGRCLIKLDNPLDNSIDTSNINPVFIAALDPLLSLFRTDPIR